MSMTRLSDPAMSISSPAGGSRPGGAAAFVDVAQGFRRRVDVVLCELGAIEVTVIDHRRVDVPIGRLLGGWLSAPSALPPRQPALRDDLLLGSGERMDAGGADQLRIR